MICGVVNTSKILRNRVLTGGMLDCFSNLSVTGDGKYHTEEEAVQTKSKVVKVCGSKFHCVASVLLVAWHSIGQSLT